VNSLRPGLSQSILNIPIAFLFILGSCISKDGPDSLSADRVKRLLSLDTGKVWITKRVRVDGDEVPLSDCKFQNYFSFSSTLTADTLFYIGSDTICSTLLQDTLSNYHWSVVGDVKDIFSDSIVFTDVSGNKNFRTVKSITSNTIEWEYVLNNALYREEYVWYTGEIK